MYLIILDSNANAQFIASRRMLMSACSLAMPAKLAMLVCAAINSINPRHLISSKLRVEHGGTASTGSSNLSISSEYLFPGQLALEAEHARQYTLNIDRNVYVAAFGKASLGNYIHSHLID